jgi:hypothetical protein
MHSDFPLNPGVTVAVNEGFLGIPANWDLWVHLFCGEVHTLATGKRGTRWAVRAGGLTLTLRDTGKGLYPLCTITSNNTEWEKGWFYLRNDDVGLPPYTGKVLVGKPGAWFYGLSPPAQQRRLEPLTNTLRHLADSGLGAASIIANFHHQRIIPLMERELRIFKMSDTANPTSLVRSRLLQERFPKEYATTRARHMIDLKVVPHSDDNLWSFVMLPDAQSVSTFFLPFCVLVSRSSVELVAVQAAQSYPPTARSQAVGRAAQQRERERAALVKEKRIRRQECPNQYYKEYRLHEQQGLSPPPTLANSS